MSKKIAQLTQQQSQVFEKYFLEDNGEFYFEGVWYRDQRPENKTKSGYVDQTTRRRRFIHFYNTYISEHENDKNFMSLKNYYVYVSNTLPKVEIDEYLSKIYQILQKNGYILIKKQIDLQKVYQKEQMEVVINLYQNHPQNITEFPKDYISCDIVIHNKGYEYKHLYNRMWALSRKTYRLPDEREQPTYTTDAKQILNYLPAQVEMGCGPSIAAGIPPLYEMHETYRVQNHETGKFYFSEQDTLIADILENPDNMFEKFSQTPLKCIRANHTQGYEIFNKLYKQGYFKGTVYNNNFDRLVKRFDIPEKILRIYDFGTYLPKVDFDPSVKSLICMGCHADRRQIEKQAREKGLKIIFIDPEGFYAPDGSFEEYLIEGPKTGDIIYKTTFEDAMQNLLKEIENEKNSRI